MRSARLVTTSSLDLVPPGAIGTLRAWSWQRWLLALSAASVAALLTGVPTDIVPTDLFHRMIPASWWAYPVWAASSVLLGLIAATYLQRPSSRNDRAKGALGGGFLSFLAVGCPVCNKLVVAALGVGGALSYFEPIQPWLAAGSLVLLAATLRLRLRSLAACSVAATPTAPLQ
jgi:hypothetical protein